MSTRPITSAPPIVVIEATRGFSAVRLREMWEYRELLFFLIWRDVKVRYKQTALGALWAILQPLTTMIVFTLFFGRIAKIDSGGVPYPVFYYSALVPWTFFSQGVTMSANSLIGSANLITKVYFPRPLIPMAAILAGVIDFLIAVVILLPMCWFYGVPVTANLVAMVPLLILAFIAALGAGLWLSALNVEYRDVRHVMPFLIQIWLFLTPVIYPAQSVAKWLAGHGLPIWLLGLNPMSGVIEGFRWAFGAGAAPSGALLVSSTVVAIVLVLTGTLYFRKMERSFADVV